MMRTRPGRPGIDEKTRGVALGVGLGLLLGGAACDALDRNDKPASEQPAADAAEPAPGEATAPSPTEQAEEPTRPPSMLAGIIDRAIEPPPEGGSTYRVDAYVAALIVEQLRRDPLPFMAWRKDAPDAPGPTAGFRVGALLADDAWTKLGLAEGDIIESVNGVPTGEAGWSAEAIGRGENRVTVTIFRDDVLFTLSYRLMGGMAWYGLVQEQQAPPEGEGEDDGDPSLVAAASPDDDDGSRGAGVGASPSKASGSPGSSASGGSGASPGTSGSKRPSSGSKRPSSGTSGGSRPSGKTVAQCSTPQSCTLDKAYFDSLVRSPAKLQSQANVVPAIRNDIFSGYKLKSVRSGSAVHQLGFRSGDKITHINGRDLTNDLEAMQLYMGLSSTRTFKIRYVRGGATKMKTVSVK